MWRPISPAFNPHDMAITLRKTPAVAFRVANMLWASLVLPPCTVTTPTIWLLFYKKYPLRHCVAVPPLPGVRDFTSAVAVLMACSFGEAVSIC